MKLMEKQNRSWAFVALALAMIGLLGFVVLALIPESSKADMDEPLKEYAIYLAEPVVTVDVDGFWQEAGYVVADHAIETEKRRDKINGQAVDWFQTKEEFTLVPTDYNLDLESGVMVFAQKLLAEGHNVSLERDEEGYWLGILIGIPGSEQKVVGKAWRFEQLSPMALRNNSPNLPSGPIMAVVIDDWGYSSQAAEQLLQFPFPLTIAVLPYLDSSIRLGEWASSLGHDVILHQPMEALDGMQNPGPGAIYLNMTDEEITAQLVDNLQHLPMIVGVNNHMGSKATSDRRVMEQLFTVLRSHGLFFIDSHTINTSVAGQVAEDLGVSYAVNNLFIDNISDEEEIMQQIRKGLNIAQRNGKAIIIGHVRSKTAAALWSMVPEIVEAGVQLVPVSALLSTPQD